MTRIVLDDTVLALLPQSDKVIEICDAQGNVRGVFQAVHSLDEISLEPAISEEEMRWRAAQPLHGRQLSEIIADLESRK
ncbi:hypothetical protein ETAA8_15760 [Anatilimnocola aggregata]|uniref:Uncharacterized protein n=1 Tax=Anatilimnocola aggregata TaxID=2528021 RepID=A0A517Y8C7_9BACT|nr:hypothetical protein [Anatilimnocola aggregata]QDU26498.1 hypothetical protein ETAA8_15760 [Anatilimnocola aggregata]